jgi:hypothetical protein
VNEKSTYTTSEFLKKLEDILGFKIKLIQTDNGEFVNDPEVTEKKSRYSEDARVNGNRTSKDKAVLALAEWDSRTQS